MKRISNAIVLAITTIALVVSSLPVAAIAEEVVAAQNAAVVSAVSDGETNGAASTGDGAEQGGQANTSQQADSEAGGSTTSASASNTGSNASSSNANAAGSNEAADSSSSTSASKSNGSGSTSGTTDSNNATSSTSGTADGNSTSGSSAASAVSGTTTGATSGVSDSATDDVEPDATSGAPDGTNAVALSSDAPSVVSDTTYAHSASATSNGVTFTVQWNDSTTTGEATTFHVTKTGGSSNAKVRMDAPLYWDNGSREVIADPSRVGWTGYAYTLIGDSYDYSLEFTASGSYNIHFYFMDIDNNVGYLRTEGVWVTVNDTNRPAVSTIVSNAVAQAKANTDGSDYAVALYLHDWLLDQLEYDRTYVWCSAESALTRHKGTCQAYTDAYTKLLTAAGIGNSQIRDTADKHTWNAVKLDGEWYQIDCTWDDDGDSAIYGFDARHLYFGLTDELMAAAHPGHTAIYSADGYATRSTSLADNYFVRTGTADEWANAYVVRIQAKLNAKVTSFSIISDNAINPPKICGVQNGIVAAMLNSREWKTSDGTKVNLTAASVVTTASSTSWTAVYQFTAEYLTGYYDVSLYKESPSSSSWTHPEKDGYAFAGWYADESCETAYTATTGYAYARFVPVSSLVRFQGCSLVPEAEGGQATYETTTLRFGYEFSVPQGCERLKMGWDCSNATTGSSGYAAAANYWMAGGASVRSNLTVTGIRRAGERSTYSTAYGIRGRISYTTPDGTAVEAAEPQAQRQTVRAVASSIASGGMGSASDRAYAKGILGD